MKHIHLIGIGGSGLSAIARLLVESGYIVSGSDRQLTPIMEQLQLSGARIMIGHHPDHIAGADLVVRSSAVSSDNEEVVAAQAAGIPVLKRAELLTKLTTDKQVIAVAGTHGKTTITSMLSWMLSSMGLEPSYLIGGISKNLGTNAHSGKGNFFVIEADEYDSMFLGLRPAIAVVTNIEHDHPDCFPTVDDYFQAFIEFAKCVDKNGIMVMCLDNPGSAELFQLVKRQGMKTTTYGFNSSLGQGQPEYKATDLILNESGSFQFRLCKYDNPLAEVSLQVPGEHNVQNAVAALVVADQLKLSVEKAVQSLGEFLGTGRRFEVRGEVGGIIVIDDYAHHPSEIRATLASARSRYPGQSVWAVWQPHTFSRTQLLFEEFTQAFEDADHVLVTEVFGAREASSNNFSAKRIVEAMEHPDATFISGVSEVPKYLLDRLSAGDILIVLSAGDGVQISTNFLEILSQKRSAAHA